MSLSDYRKLFDRLFARPRPSRPARSRSFRPRLEALEGRTLLTNNLLNGVLTIQGTPQDDFVTVEFDDRGTAWAYDDRVVVTELGAPTPVTYYSKWTLGPAGNLVRKVTDIVFYAYGGHDRFGNDTDINSMASGGAGMDQFQGGSGSDTFYGGDHWDVLDGNGGADHLYGEGDMDHLYGGAGDDYLNGGQDGFGDGLQGGSGSDTFVAEYYWVSIGGILFQKNRDAPSDFAAGDQIVWS